MPKKSALKCYFGCATNGPLHQFPKPFPHNMEKFMQWKEVLSEETKARTDSYIYNAIRLCDHHFEPFYRSNYSFQLTRNAVPTLNLFQNVKSSCSTKNGSQMDVPTDSIEQDSDHHADVPTDGIRDDSDTDSCSLPDFIMNESISEEQQHVKVLSPQSSYVRRLVSSPESSDVRTLVSSLQPCEVRKFVSYSQLSEVRKLKAKVLKLQGRCKSLRQQLHQARKASLTKAVLKEVEHLPERSKVFIQMQLTKSGKLARGRRFTPEEKALSLSIYKESHEVYNFLKRNFTLPSIRAMQTISLAPSINDNLLDYLKRAAAKLSEEKRLCILMFDEVPLSPGLLHDQSLDKVHGSDASGDTTEIIADHALVFMIKSLKCKFHQSICFRFCKSATNMLGLKNLLVNLLTEIQSTGLKVVCTICNQSLMNRNLIENLVTETKKAYLMSGYEYTSLAFEINGVKIFPIYDPSDALKDIRNNFLENNMEFIYNNENKVAEWRHIEMLFNVDMTENDVPLSSKWTERHVIKDKIPKTKLKYAAQVFSESASKTKFINE